MAKNDYVYAVARIRVLEKGLLTDSFIEQLVNTPDVAGVQRLLSERGWEENLSLEEEKIRKTMNDLGADPEAFEILSLPDSYHNLKAGIKDAAASEVHHDAYYEGVSPSKEEIKKILDDKTWERLPSHMQQAAQEIYEVFIHTLDGQMCDIMTDKACMDAIIKMGEASKEEVIRDYAESSVASSDIKIAARCCLTGKSVDFIKKALASCKTLDVNRLADAAAEGMESLMAYLSLTSYKEAAEALKNSFSEFEIWCDDVMVDTLKPQKTNPFSIGPLFAYMIGRKNEIKTVRIILTGKENGLSNEAIRERVRQMYG